MEINENVPTNASNKSVTGIKQRGDAYQLNSNYAGATIVPLLVILWWLEVYN